MSVAACPGCMAAGPVAEKAAADADLPTHTLILPTIHCLGCMQTVETTLTALPGIRSARVNLSQKRVSILADPEADPNVWIEALAAAGFEAHEAQTRPAGASDAALLMRLGVAGFAMMNVMLLSVAVWSGAADATRDMFHWIAAAIALPAVLYCAEPFFRNAWSALRMGRLNMDVPIALAIALACGLSLYETATGGAHAYFDAALSLTFFLLAGRFLEGRMRRAARSAAADLAALEPSRVIVIDAQGARSSQPVASIAKGDRLWLAAGSRVPVDGRLAAPAAQIDRSALTGESEPAELSEGADLIAGDVVLTGPVEVIATATSEGSTLRRMVQFVAMAEAARGRYTSLADRAARLYAPLVHGLALVAGLAWFWGTGQGHLALTVAISTLIITCPCALGLAVPAVATVSTGRLFRAGILVKSDTALERLAEVDTVVLDKTGTLTRPALEIPPEATAPELQILKALAAASNHPLSQSLLAGLEDVEPACLSHITEVPGQGVEARFSGRPVRLGSGRWLQSAPGTAFETGTRVLGLVRREVPVPGTPEMLAALRAEGMPVHVLTGDTEANARRIGAALGIDQVHAGMSPEDKDRFVQDLQARGHKVLMAGDGLNDTLALTRAFASVAPGSALEASQNAADVVFLGGQLTQLGLALRAARSARRRILENFGLAALYNSVAIPLAVAGLATPFAAAIAMSLSSITVTLNALRVRAL